MAKDKTKLSTGQFKVWKDRVRVAKKRHEPINEAIKTWRAYYEGHQWLDNDAYASYPDKVVDNIIFSNIRTMMPSINFKDPKIFVEAKKKPYTKENILFDTGRAAFLMESILNYYYKELSMKREIDKALLDAFIGPWGIMFTGYATETEKVDVEKDSELEINELIKSESPYGVRISPMDMIVDSEATESYLTDARWIAIRWVKTLSEVKANPLYKNTDNLKANTSIAKEFERNNGRVEGITPESSKTLKGEDDGARVEGWDIHDKEHKQIITVVLEHDKALSVRSFPIDMDGFPVEILFFNENPDSLFPISDVEISIPAQNTLNCLESLQVSHVKRVSQRKYLMKEDALDEDAQKWLQFGGDGSLIKVTSGDIHSAITPLQDATVSQDLYVAIRQIKEDNRELLGIGSFEKGIASKFETATEPALIQQSVSTRRDERAALLEDFIVRIMRKIAIILQTAMNQNLDVPLDEKMFKKARTKAPERLMQIAGPEESQVIFPWLTISKEDILGEFEFDLDVGSARPINSELRKRDAMQLSQILQGNPFIDTFAATKLLIEAFEVNGASELLRDPEQVAQEQSAAAQAEIDAQVAVDAPKRETDIAKTIMKNETALDIAEGKEKNTTLQNIIAATKEDKETVQ